MVDDPRESRQSISRTVEIASGDGTPMTAVDLVPERTMTVEEVRVDYSPDGSANSRVWLADEPDGTASGDIEDELDSFFVAPGDDKNPDMVYEDVSDDVLVWADGSQDGAIIVTIGGYKLSG